MRLVSLQLVLSGPSQGLVARYPHRSRYRRVVVTSVDIINYSSSVETYFSLTPQRDIVSLARTFSYFFLYSFHRFSLQFLCQHSFKTPCSCHCSCLWISALVLDSISSKYRVLGKQMKKWRYRDRVQSCRCGYCGEPQWSCYRQLRRGHLLNRIGPHYCALIGNYFLSLC